MSDIPGAGLDRVTHRCGEPATDHVDQKCVNCGCWGDLHPVARFGGGCVCRNFQNRWTLMTPTERRIDALEREAKVGPYAET